MFDEGLHLEVNEGFCGVDLPVGSNVSEVDEVLLMVFLSVSEAGDLEKRVPALLVFALVYLSD